MYSLFKNINGKRNLGLFAWIFLFPLFSAAQSYPVMVTALVYPPYSTQFSYYVDHPNKIMVSLLNTSPQALDVYLSGSFSGDNGIAINSEDGYKPPSAITLEPNIPFQLSQYNIGDVFSTNHLVYLGITENELMNMQGLPEGNYRICFMVYDFYSDQQLSADEPGGCSNAIIIQYIDPPSIITPNCGDSLFATTPQNILFSWTPPVGAGPETYYHFTMVEMHPDDRNPNDAIASAVPPFFYDTDVTGNQLLFSPSEPHFMEGRSYAFVVQAIDPYNTIVFNNDGVSEACWFNYKSNDIPDIQTDSLLFVDLGIAGFLGGFELLPNTKVNGQLLYKLASSVEGSSAGGGSSTGYNGDSGGGNYQNMVEFNMSNGGNANNNNLSIGGFTDFGLQQQGVGNLSLSPPYGSGTINEAVIDLGGAEPLRNTMIRLVARFGLVNGDGFYHTREGLTNSGSDGTINVGGYKFFDLSGNEVSANRALATVNKVLDVCTTDNQGNFSFDFQTDFFTGPIYAASDANGFLQGDLKGIISLKLEVINQKFCSPDVDIFTKPGDAIDIPSQVALIKDFDLHLEVVSEYDVYRGNPADSTIYIGHDTKPKAIPGGQPIPNAIVKVLRDVQQLNNEHPSILLAEGQQLGSITKNENGEFKDVFIGQTDVEGNIVIPHLVEHWAITDGENKSPYFFSVRTRLEQADSAYENTLYNYFPFFGDITGIPISVESSGPTLLDDDAGWSGYAPVVYNHFYSPPQSATDREVRLDAAPPEIKGRLMVESNLENMGIEDALVKLFGAYTSDMPGLMENSVESNHAGFFRFRNLNVNVDENGIARGPFRRIDISGSMFKTILWPPNDEQALNLKYGELYFKEFQLEPKRILLAKVVDENSNPIAAYVRLLDNNPYYKTETRWDYDDNGNIYVSGEYVGIPVLGYGINRIEIQALSNQYFADTISLAQLPDNPNERVSLVVSKKQHRLKLQIKNKETNGAIANADVIVGDTLAFDKTGPDGFVELLFPSPGEQFLIKVTADNYAPTQVSYNIPASNTWHYEYLALEPSTSISGIITQKNSGQTIDSALVFIRLQSTDGHTVYLESYSGTDGKYTLNGIPMSLTSTDIHVVKDGTDPSYVGTTQTIVIEPFAYPVPSYDFQLTAVNNLDLSNIWGFPVSIESLVSKPGHGVTISGFFHDLPNIPGFETLNENEKVYFKNIKIDPEPSDNKISPLSSKLVTETYSIPIKINGGFEGKFHVPSPWFNPRRLELKKNGDNGAMSGALKLDLASFKFAYDFHGDFYLGDDTLHNDMALFKSVSRGFPGFYHVRKFIFDLGSSYTPVPVNNFRVFGFNASSGFATAFYLDNAIHIGTILHTDIQMANGLQSLDLKIQAGEVEVTKENIEMKPNANNLISFDLEKWKVESTTAWFFDKTRDAIVIPKSLILTGLGVDASVKGLNIRPNALYEGEIDMEGGLSLGGIATLGLANGLEPKFNYDAGVGHYRISIVGNAQGPAAWTNDLPATNDRLDFTSIGILSDNSSVLSLGKHMIFHNLLDVFVDQIMTGNGFFSLAGMPDLGIPGFVPTRAVVTYTKPNGQLHFKLEPLNGAVDCNANVVYKLEQKANSQSLTNKKYTAYGDFFIKPPPGESGEKLSLKGFLTKTPSECYIDAIPGTIEIGKETMNVTDGKISVANDTWGTLRFNCKTNSTGLDDENVIAYTVHGGIEANGAGIKVDQIDTPLGNLNMAYLFPEKALVGDLTVNGPLNMGFASLQSGAMDMRFDPGGFYMAFSGTIEMLQNQYLGGFILGDYSHDLSNVVAPILKDFKKNPPDFSSLHGFYAIGQRNLVNASFPIPVMPPIMVSVKAGLGGYTRFDYSNPQFTIGGYAFVDAMGGVNVPLCGFVGAEAHEFLDVEGGYENSALSIQSCGLVNVSAGACGLNGSITIKNKNKLSSNGNNEFSLSLGGNCN